MCKAHIGSVWDPDPDTDFLLDLDAEILTTLMLLKALQKNICFSAQHLNYKKSSD
jgi:hypothetical protein